VTYENIQNNKYSKQPQSASNLTLLDILTKRSKEMGNQIAFVFLQDGVNETDSLTYEQLKQRVKTVANRLQTLNLSGERALLLYPSGLDFIVGFLGCLSAGVIAVPAYPPRRNKKLHRLEAIAKDAQASVALTTRSVLDLLESGLSKYVALANLNWLATNELSDSHESNTVGMAVNSDTLAYLQYTSGSTGTPKGVMVSHGNLLHNLEALDRGWKHDSSSVMVTWLPTFHDMGLIYGVLQPLYNGIPCYMMSPTSFMERPLNWLQAISKYKATHSAAPNFAYELCVSNISEVDRDNLDLSNWQMALNAAEPVRAEVMERFSQFFQVSGFNRVAFCPGYGLAEATLKVTAVWKQDRPTICHLATEPLSHHQILEAIDPSAEEITTLVGCGLVESDTDIVIINPETQTQCVADEVGEIWVSSPSIAQGYWQRHQETKETFQAYIADAGQGPFLRTGDLGFLRHDELFITGRLKDLIIIRGRNYYPNDLEMTVQQSHPALRANCGAAFSIVMEGEEKLIITQEVKRQYLRRLPVDEVISEICQQISEQYELQVYAVVLLRTASIPKTSSGKIQRRACRSNFIAGKLQVVAQSKQNFRVFDQDNIETRSTLIHLPPSERRILLQSALQSLIGHCLASSVEIPPQQPLTSWGLDSLAATQLVAQIRDRFGVEISLPYLFESATVEQLVQLIQTSWQEGNSTKEELTFPLLIPASEERYQPFPLTDIQQAYWIGRQGTVELGKVASHVYLEIQTFALDVEQLTQAWQQLIERHDMLRVVILPTGEQKVLPQVQPYTIQVTNLSNLSVATANDQLAAIRTEIAAQSKKSSDHWPLFEIRLTQLPQQQWQLHLYFDLLIADSWSLLHLLEEWFKIYQDPHISLKPLSCSFRDYVLAEKSVEKTRLYSKSRDYWLSRLDTLPSPPQLPLAQNPTSLNSPEFTSRRARLNITDSNQLKNLAKVWGITPSGLILATFAEVLATWSQQPNFTLNLTLLNRLPLHPQVEEIVGDFTSLIPLEVNYSPSISFRERAIRWQQQLWQDLEHRYFSGVRVQREMAKRHGSANVAMPIVFTSLLGLSKSNSAQATWEAFGKLTYSLNPTAQVWLNNQVWEEAGALVVSWDALDALFPVGLLDDLFATYNHLLKELADSESLGNQSQLQLLPPNQQRLWHRFNQTQVPTSEAMLHTLFLNQVSARSQELAVIAPQHTFTYEQLAQLSQQLGWELRQMGTKPNQLVAVVMEKGWEQIVAVIGILMAGAAYVPIDPALPESRRWQIIEQSHVNLAITQVHLKERLTWPIQVQCLCISEPSLERIETISLTPVQTPNDLAYVIYTSGSTGVPKGVMIDHRGAVNTLLAINNNFGISYQDKVLALSALNFDLSVYDIFGVLAVGGTIVLPEADLIKDPSYWLTLMQQHQITLWNSVPMLMQMCIEYLSTHPLKYPYHLSKILLSGDYIPLSLPEQIQSQFPSAELISLGGATEASIWSIFYPIDKVDPKWKTIPYGHPLDNQKIYILNELLEPCPLWVPGHIYISGMGLAKGYWQDEQRTQSNFFEHPRMGEKLYHTGDLGRLLANGEIEFLGREDLQVKFKGYRIELGEIEAILTQHPQLKAAIAQIWQEHLICYVIRQPQQTISPLELRTFLEEKLPSYMIPTSYIFLDQLPLSANGKVDRKTLKPTKKISANETRLNYQPTTEVEKTLVSLVQEIFEVSPIGIHDHFFEVGATSLHLVRLHSRLQTEISRDIPIVELFRHPTVGALAKLLNQQQIKSLPSNSFQKIATKRKEFIQLQQQRFKKRNS